MCGGCGGYRGCCTTFSLTDFLPSSRREGLRKMGYIHHNHHRDILEFKKTWVLPLNLRLKKSPSPLLTRLLAPGANVVFGTNKGLIQQ